MKVKKLFLLVLCLVFSFGGLVSAHGETAAAGKNLTVLVNGVPVISEANLVLDDKVYTSVKAFADLFHKSFQVSADKKSVEFNGKKINGVRINKGEATALIDDLASAVSGKVTWDKARKEAYVLVLPQGPCKFHL